VERLLLLAEGDVRAEDVRAVLPRGHGGAGDGDAGGSGTLAERVLDFERQVMLAELRRHNYRIAETARTLGLERSHLYKKCEQLGIDLKQERRNAEDAT
jgi:DNA-binding NtrC family response regulator